MSSQQPSQNVSFALNNLGPWADPLIAGIGGSAASLNFLEPLASALPVIKNNPGAYGVPYLLAAQDPGASTPGPSQTPDPATAESWLDTVKRILDPWNPGLSPADKKTLTDSASQYATQFSVDLGLQNYAKNILVAGVGLILLIFGLWILLYPSVKPIIVSAAKDAGKAAAA